MVVDRFMEKPRFKTGEEEGSCPSRLATYGINNAQYKIISESRRAMCERLKQPLNPAGLVDPSSYFALRRIVSTVKYH